MKALKTLNPYFWKHKILLFWGLLFIIASNFFNIFNIFLIQAANAALKYKKEEKILNEGNAEKVNWEISKSSPKYSTQVFILGESV